MIHFYRWIAVNSKRPGSSLALYDAIQNESPNIGEAIAEVIERLGDDKGEMLLGEMLNSIRNRMGDILAIPRHGPYDWVD